MFQLFIVIIVIAIVFFFVSLRRALFQVHVENGKITKTQGSISPSVRDDFETAIANVKSAKIIGEKTQQGVKLSSSGDIDEGAQQRLRNIVGIHYR